MSSYKRRQDGTANQEATQSSEKKSSNDNNSIKEQIHKYERVEEFSEEKAGPSQATNAKHPMIAANKKNMNLIPAVESQNPPVGETKALLNLPARSNKTFHKPYESIIYSKGSRLYSSRATDSKSTKPRISKPQIPDTWGQEPTKPFENDKTALRSTLRDHPYTPARRKNLPTQSRKVLKDGTKLQKDAIRLPNGTALNYSNNEVRIGPQEEFDKLNEVRANRARREAAASSYVDERTSFPNEDKQTVEMPNHHSGIGELKMQANNDAIVANNAIKNYESRDLVVDESSVLVHTCFHGHVSQCPSNTSSNDLLPERSDQPSPKEITDIVSSLKLVSSQEKEGNLKAGPSKARDLFAQEYSEPPDSFNNPITSTEPTNPSEMSEVGLSGSDTNHEEGAMTCEIAKFNLQVLSSTCSASGYLEEPLRNLSDQFVSSRNDSEKSIKNYGASWSPAQGSVVSGTRDLLIKDLSTSFVSNSSSKKLQNKSSKPVSVSMNSTSITESEISIEGNELPSFLPTSPTPVPQKIPRLSRIESERRVPSLEVELMVTNHLAEEVQTVVDTNSLKMRQEVPQFKTWQQPSVCLAFPNSAIIVMQSSAFRLISPIPLIFCDDVITQWLQIISSSLFLHFFIPIASTSLYIPSNEKTPKYVSLGNLLSTIVGQVTGTSGLMLLTAIRNHLWSSGSEVPDSEAHPGWYQSNHDNRVDIRDTIIAISSSTEDFIRLVMHTHKNNPSVILSLIDTICEIIPQNPTYTGENFQMKSIESFEEYVPPFQAIWMDANHPIALRFKTLKNLVCWFLQTAELTSPAVWSIPQMLGSSDWIPRELRTMTPILIDAELDILWRILRLKLTEGLLHLVKTTPTVSVIDQQWQLGCDFGILLIHNAVNPVLTLLLGRRLAQFFHFMT